MTLVVDPQTGIGTVRTRGSVLRAIGQVVPNAGDGLDDALVERIQILARESVLIDVSARLRFIDDLDNRQP